MQLISSFNVQGAPTQKNIVSSEKVQELQQYLIGMTAILR